MFDVVPDSSCFCAESIDGMPNNDRVNMIALRLIGVPDWHEIVERSVAKLMLELTDIWINGAFINAPPNAPLSSISPPIQNGWRSSISYNNCLMLSVLPC